MVCVGGEVVVVGLNVWGEVGERGWGRGGAALDLFIFMCETGKTVDRRTNINDKLLDLHTSYGC